jgi:SAM-dependent MidA family methyltransferase
MAEALYAPGAGFFTRPDANPREHFRTSAHAGPVFGRAIARLVTDVDAALGHPARLDVVDVGAGRGELLRELATALAEPLRQRVRLIGVEVAERPSDLPQTIRWRRELPERATGVLLATEWLDNVPIDVVVRDGAVWRYALVDKHGNETVGDVVDADDDAWLRAWWPDGDRAEVGRTRDAAWAGAVERLSTGLALAVDYGHTRAARPPYGTLTSFVRGRQASPVPDGSRDLTAHVAADAVATAGSAVAGEEPLLVRQADALAALGLSGRRPPIDAARADPAGYVRALADASTTAELIDPDGLGAHFWLLQPVGIGVPPTMTG